MTKVCTYEKIKVAKMDIDVAKMNWSENFILKKYNFIIDYQQQTKYKNMKTKQIWANFAVADLERTTKFYTELGFTSNNSNSELTSFSFGENNFIINFFLKEIIEKNTKTEFSTEMKLSLVFPQQVKKKLMNGLKL